MQEKRIRKHFKCVSFTCTLPVLLRKSLKITGGAYGNRTRLYRTSYLGFQASRDILRTRASMSDVTQILQAIEQGDAKAANELLPLVYQELRRLAAHKMANEAPGHTLQPTALVHEAWLHLGRDK